MFKRSLLALTLVFASTQSVMGSILSNVLTPVEAATESAAPVVTEAIKKVATEVVTPVTSRFSFGGMYAMAKNAVSSVRNFDYAALGAKITHLPTKTLAHKSSFVASIAAVVALGCGYVLYRKYQNYLDAQYAKNPVYVDADIQGTWTSIRLTRQEAQNDKRLHSQETTAWSSNCAAQAKAQKASENYNDFVAKIVEQYKKAHPVAQANS